MSGIPRRPSPKWISNLQNHIIEYRTELVRVCPEVEELERADIPDDLMPVEILGVLRTLPNAAGLERLHGALAAYRTSRKRV
jgi:hypothetical protein